MEEKYWRKWKESRDSEAGDYLARKYLPLVDYVVHKSLGQLGGTVQKDDLVSYAYDGLLDALNKFEPARDLKFETYASFRIRGAILDALRSNDHLTRTLRSKVKKVEAAFATLEQQMQRTVTLKEVSSYLQMTENEISEILKTYQLTNSVSINDEIDDHENQPTSLFSMIEDQAAVTPEKYLDEKAIKEAIAEAISALPEKEKLVVSLYYYEELKFNEIATVLEVSTPRISQLHSRAIARLQDALTKNEDFLMQEKI